MAAKEKNVTDAVVINTTISINDLNINDLNAQLKDRLLEWV